VIAAWKRSGRGGNEYARSIGVVPQRLFWWRRRLAEQGASGPATLIPVTIRSAAMATAPIVITTTAGARIEVNEIDATTAGWVAAVLNGERS
jgi:hypothetical protein